MGRDPEARIELPVAVSAHVRHAVSDADVVILDLRANRYSILDGSARCIWEAAQRLARWDALVDALVDEFDVEAGRAAADAAAFLDDCRRRGWIGQGAEPRRPVRSTSTRPRATGAWIWLLRTYVELRARGLWATYRHLASFGVPERIGDGGGLLGRALRAFSRAENALHVRRAPDDCLLRSFALAFFRRSSALRAVHCIGVSRYPFAAHAWVEVDGRPIGESFDPSDHVLLSRLD